MSQKISFPQFGMEFLRNVFTEQRLKKELDKSFVRQVPINTKEATGTANISSCTVRFLSGEGRPEWERVFDVFVPFNMYLQIPVLLGNEHYNVNGQVRMRLWLEAYPPLVVYLNGAQVPPSEVQLTATGDGNWWNSDVAKKFGLEAKLKESMAKQFTEEFQKSYESRRIDIMAQVK
ncbi:hypothetical protein EPN18_05335 [bacterium]|nr:MAG: hypothetical protein EPN18_05335 [bacterium]